MDVRPAMLRAHESEQTSNQAADNEKNSGYSRECYGVGMAVCSRQASGRGLKHELYKQRTASKKQSRATIRCYKRASSEDTHGKKQQTGDDDISCAFTGHTTSFEVAACTWDRAGERVSKPQKNRREQGSEQVCNNEGSTMRTSDLALVHWHLCYSSGLLFYMFSLYY